MMFRPFMRMKVDFFLKLSLVVYGIDYIYLFYTTVDHRSSLGWISSETTLLRSTARSRSLLIYI